MMKKQIKSERFPFFFTNFAKNTAYNEVFSIRHRPFEAEIP